MNYLFFDLEYATSRNGLAKICEYGYVITNEKFEVIKRGNLIINPNINKKQWDIQVVNDILTRSIEEYELYPKFDYYYYQIDSMIKKADYIIGHTLSGDANALNNECRRYNKDSINYVFYDIKEFYKQYKNSKDSTSVTNILKELNIKGEGKKHDAESDAYNTMLELKEMLHNLDLTFEELCELVPEAKDETINFSVKSLEKVLDEKISRIINVNKNGNGLHRYKNRNNYIKFRQFLDNVKPNGPLSNTFVNKVVLISLVYQENHFIQMLNLVQLIVNNSGSVTLKHKNANV